MFRRQTNAGWQKRKGLLSTKWRLVSKGKPLFEVPDDPFQVIVRGQMKEAVALGHDGKGQRWWMYRDEFYAEDEGVTADDATALAEADCRRRTRRVEQAHTIRHLDEAQQFSRVAIPVEVRNAVWRRDQGCCTSCGSQADLQFDHIIPVSLGGSSTDRNLQLLCGPCNRRKAASLG